MTEPVQKPGRSRQDYVTPMAFIGAVEDRFGPLICDLACTSANTRAPTGYYFDRGVDALRRGWAEDWPDGNLWLNPPFGNVGPFAEKCASESLRRDGSIIMLTAASIDTRWFSRHVNGKAMVLGLSPRLSFVGCTASFPKALMLSVWGSDHSGFDVWNWKLKPVSAEARTLSLPGVECQSR